MKRFKGSLTIFLSMVLVFVMGLFFTLTEVTRFFALKAETPRAADLSFESLFAEYNIPLWEDYGILGIDGAYGSEKFDIKKVEKRLSNFMELNGTSDGVNFFQEAPSKSEISEYTLLTDDSNAAFIKEAAIFMETHVLDSAVNEVKNKAEEYTSSKKTVSNEDVENADYDEVSATDELRMELSEDPRDTEENMKTTNSLDFYVPDSKTVYDNSFIITDLPSKRHKNKGTSEKLSVNITESTMFKFYLYNYFQSYETDLHHSGLKYEQEYLIAGCKNDSENLKTVINKIILSRQLANNAAILKDSTKMGEVRAFATVLGGASANPAVIEGIRIALIESWAYVESVLDVRRILAGGKISVIKSPEEWTSSVYTLPIYLEKSQMAKNCSSGFDYDSFLKTFIFLMSDSTLSNRALDLIENAICLKEHYENFKVDNLIVKMKADMNYQAKPLFLSYVLFLTGDIDIYDFPIEEEKSYLSLKLKPG